jgi:predicted PurR-regulated permease PerM
MTQRRNQARWLALLAATALALYLCWLMLQPFVGVLAWAVVLVIVFYPAHRRLVQRTGWPGLSALVSSILVIVTILVPLTFITLAVANELAGAITNVQGALQTLLDPNQTGPTRRAIEWLSRYVDFDQLVSGDLLSQHLGEISRLIAQRTLILVGGAVGVLVSGSSS